MANGVWKKALKKLVSSICAVLIMNFSDPHGIVWSKEWLLHVLAGVVILSIFTEAQYWKEWADSPNGNGDNMKLMIAFTLAVCLTMASCTPLERTAYRVVVTSKGFLDSERAAHPDCINGASVVGDVVTPSKVCSELARAVAAKDLLIDAAEVYCASPTFSSGTGVCTPPKKGTPAYQQASDKLQAAISVYSLAAKDLKGAIR